MADGDPGLKYLKQLTKALADRKNTLKRCEDYYDGKHRLAFAGKKFREAFGGLFDVFADNWMEIVVDAVEERLNIEGFRFGKDPKADDDAWAMWQDSDLDADSQLAHTDSLVMGYGYGLVWADNDGDPLITVESPLEAIVAHKSGSRRERAAGLKQWLDDDGYLYACVYLPDALYKYRSKGKKSTPPMTGGDPNNFWEQYQPPGDDNWPLNNPLGVVPLVPLYNKPRTTKPGIGTSEIASVIPVQDAINKLCTDMIVASEFGAYRQRWASGLTLDEDDKGNKVFPFKNGPGNVWVGEGGDDNPGGVRFGEFGETNLQNLVGSIHMFVQHVASQTRTPPHYLDAAVSRLSGESIRAAESGLVAKTRRKMRYLGESWEEILRLGFLVTDDPRAHEESAETIWGDPSYRTEGEHVDATLKKQSLNVPDAQLWEDLGYTPQQIARFQAMRAHDALLGLLQPGPAKITERIAVPPAPGEATPNPAGISEPTATDAPPPEPGPVGPGG